jgi:hypothetical protein
MAISQDDVNNWFATNPNASQQDIATAVQSLGGLSANPELAGMLGERFGTDANTVTNTYNNLTGGLPTTPVAPTVTRIEDLYQQILGRAPDAEGYKYWTDTYGTGPVTADVVAAFKSGAAPELANTGYMPSAPVTTPANFSSDAYFAANPDVATAYKADPFGLNADQYAQSHYTNYGAKEQRLADPNAIYDKIVQDAYSNIGRTGIGAGASNVDQPGLDYWKGELAAGRIAPDQFNSVFGNAVNVYKQQNPDDAYTQYVNNYQLGQQTDPLKTNLSNILSDKQISFDEANAIKSYQDQYGFSAADIARVTGRPIEEINQVLGARTNIIGQNITANLDNPLSLIDYAQTNKLSAKDLANASGGVLTEASAAALLDKGSTYQGRIELQSPEAYNQIKNLSAFTANENFGGKVQDYQIQLFTQLDTNKTGLPKQLEFEPVKTELRDDGEGGQYQVQTGGGLKTSGVAPIGGGHSSEGGSDPITGYTSTQPVTINGVPVFANYDVNGKLTGYTGDTRVTTWLDDKNRVVGNWDAEGNAKPRGMTSQGGGFIKGVSNDLAGGLADLGPIWTIAKIAYPALNLVDVALDVGRSEVNLGTGVKAAVGTAGYMDAGVNEMTALDGVNSTSGIDLGNAVSPAVQMTQNANNLRLGAAGVTAVQAAENGNYAPLLALGANVSGINKMPEVAASMNVLSAANAISTGDTSSLLTAAGNLTGSSDLKVAGAANRLINAINSGDQAALAVAGMQFSSAINANTGAATTTLRDAILGPKNIDTSKLQQGSTITPTGPTTPTTTTTTTPTNTTSTNTTSTVDTEFGNLDKAIEDQKTIPTKAPTFNDAYDAARSAYGPGKTFEWNGKTYSTDSRAENPTLAAASDATRLNNIGASTTAGGGRGSAASYANYDAAAAALGAANVNPNKGATQAEIDSYFGDGSAQYDPMGNVTMGSLNLADDKTALGRLVIDSNKAVGTAVQTGLSNLAQAGGEQVASFGGAAATVGLAGANNAWVQAGKSAENFGKSIETEASKQGTKNIVSSITAAEGFGGKLFAGVVSGFQNPGAAINLFTREGLQEVLPIGVAKSAAKVIGLFGAAGIDTALNAAESMGGVYNDTYKALIDKGVPADQADAAATRVGLAAGAITAVTSGIADAAVVKSIMRDANSSVGSAAAKTTLKEGVSENVEETATALATQYLTTGKIDWNAATTQGAIGQLVGGKTSGAITAGEGASNAADATPVTNIESVSNSVTTGLSSGKDLGATIDTSISTAIKSGESGPSVVSSAVTSAIAGGADVNATVDTAIGSAITNNVDSGSAISTTVGAAINSGADAATTITAAINSAANSNVDIHTSIDSSVTAAVKAGTDVNTAINAAVTAAVNAGVNTNVATNIATNAATNTNTNTNTDSNVVNADTVGDGSVDGSTGGSTPTPTTPPATNPATPAAAAKTSKGMGGGAAPLSASGTFLPPEPGKFKKISEDFTPLNPMLFALANVGPLKGTLEESLKEQKDEKKTMPSLMDFMFAPSVQPTIQPETPKTQLDEAPAPEEDQEQVVPAYAQGGLTGMHPMGEPQFFSQGGLGNMHVQGDGDGTSDSVPAMVAKDEFVLPADVVSSLGNGSSEAGASVLDQFVEIIRQHKQSNQPSELPPQSKGPLEYLSSAMKKGHA